MLRADEFEMGQSLNPFLKGCQDQACRQLGAQMVGTGAADQADAVYMLASDVLAVARHCPNAQSYNGLRPHQQPVTGPVHVHMQTSQLQTTRNQR